MRIPMGPDQGTFTLNWLSLYSPNWELIVSWLEPSSNWGYQWPQIRERSLHTDWVIILSQLGTYCIPIWNPLHVFNITGRFILHFHRHVHALLYLQWTQPSHFPAHNNQLSVTRKSTNYLNMSDMHKSSTGTPWLCVHMWSLSTHCENSVHSENTVIVNLLRQRISVTLRQCMW